MRFGKLLTLVPHPMKRLSTFERCYSPGALLRPFSPAFGPFSPQPPVPVAHEVQQPDPYSPTFCHQAFPPLAPAPHQVQHQAFAGIEADAEVPLLPAHVVPLHLEAGALRSAQVSTQRPWAATAETTSGHGAHATSFMCVMQEGNRECGAYETDRLHGKAN